MPRPSAQEFARMFFFIDRHDYAYRLDRLCHVVHVAIDEWDSVSRQWFKRWHECRSVNQLREVLGY